MYEPGAPAYPALLWPAFAAAAASEAAAWAARTLFDFSLTTGGGEAKIEPEWLTRNKIALELKSVRLRDFTNNRIESQPTLVCAPLALHAATLSDFAEGHSLVAALRENGLESVFVTDWRTASPEMQFLTIDNYLADLNVVVDYIGRAVDLIGLCQGGWMALVYAARFPSKVRKVVLAGAPIDISAGRSELSALSDATPLPIYDQLVKFGDGRILGRIALEFWKATALEAGDIRDLLQSNEEIASAAFERLESAFRRWYATTIDLPGAYFLEMVEKLYKRNELANGQFVALGQKIKLATVSQPMYLLAARDDELAAPAQLLAVGRLVGASGGSVNRAIAPCRHLGLFMGKDTLRNFWPQIVHWLQT